MIPYNIKEAYTPRLLVFLEEEPLSNKYKQVLLTKDQVLKFIFEMMKEENKITESVDIYKLPDLKMYHEKRS